MTYVEFCGAGHSRVAVRVGATVGILLFNGFGQCAPSLQAQSRDTSACVAATRPISVMHSADTMTLYIEPNAFAGGVRSWMLAGEPLYVWRRDRKGLATLDSGVTFFGAVFSPARTTPISRPPMNGFVTNARLRAEGEGFAAIFAETDKPSIGRDAPRVDNYWFGRIGENGWSAMERLPLPAEGQLSPERASPLIRTDSGYFFAVPLRVRRRGGIAAFGSVGRVWHIEVIPANDVAYLTSVLIGGKLRIYAVRPDSTRMPDANSLSLFSLERTGWSDDGFLIHGGSRPLHHPAVTQSANRIALSWQEHDDRTGRKSAHTAILNNDGTVGRTLTLRRDITDLIPVQGVGDALRWIVARPDTSNMPTLELMQWDGGEVVIRDVVADPFTGPSLAYVTPKGVAIAGPRISRAPGDAMIATAVLHFVERCRVPIHKVP